MKNYKLDLELNQALENVRAIIASEYFKQHDMRGNSWLESGMLKIKAFGGYDSNNNKWYKLADVAPCLDSLLVLLENNPNANFYELFLFLQASEDMKKNFGFDEKRAEDLEMGLRIWVQRNTQSNTYNFSVYNFGLNKESYDGKNLYTLEKRKYNKWHKKIDGELQRILPHK